MLTEHKILIPRKLNKFDQQSYEGRKNLYLPQYFKENLALVELAMKYLNKDSIQQYQTEERTMMAFRLADSRYRLLELGNIMSKDEISTPHKIEQLKTQLNDVFKNGHFTKCKSMGDIVKFNLKESLRTNLSLILESKAKNG